MSQSYASRLNRMAADARQILSLVPSDARDLLLIGTGEVLMALLRERQACRITELTIVSTDACTSSAADRVVAVASEQLRFAGLQTQSFDAVVVAANDASVRVPDLLKQIHCWLRPEGRVVLHARNARSLKVLSALVQGHRAESPMVSRAELERLLFQARLEVEVVHACPDSDHDDWVRNGRPANVDLGRISIRGLTSDHIEELFVREYFLRARPSQRPGKPLSSIIIVTWNQLECTRQCVRSLQERTTEPYELIIVDNGSTDGTQAFLQSVPGARVICNSANRGFAPAVNQGLAIATGEQAVLLNNDCVLTTGWLSGLLSALYSNDRIAIVGPVSNFVSGPQQIGVPYDELDGLDSFAWSLRPDRRLISTERLVGFCMAFRRSLIGLIGPLDEQFEIGGFEDDDFCRRARSVGYQLMIVPSVLVHHHGHATFDGEKLDQRDILRRNHARYRRKWNDPETPTDKPAAPTLTETGSPTPVPLSLCMIVRDNEFTIRDCLASIRPWVDEIIVVDTGSIDRTAEICRAFGARVSEFPWCDDFSAARNESLRHATGEWIFWMDSDDVMPEEQGQQLRELVNRAHSDSCLGYVLQVRCPRDGTSHTVVDHVKLIRNRPDLRFEHRIHEQILPAIRRVGGSVEFADVHVVHRGSIQTDRQRASKLERDTRILQKDLEDHPDHPFVLFNLGMTCEDAGQYADAELWLRRCLAVSGPHESHVGKASSLLVSTLKHQNRLNEAIETATGALQQLPNDTELRFRRAVLFSAAGRHADAVTDYRHILNHEGPRVFQSLDQSLTGYKLRHNLAVALEDLGQWGEAAAEWSQAITWQPNSGRVWLALARAVVRSRNTHDLIEIEKALPDAVRSTPEGTIIRSLALEHTGAIDEAIALLENAATKTDDPDVLDELARVLTRRGSAAQSVPWLRRLSNIRPNDPSVWHNLGQALIASHESGEGIECLHRSLQIRPGYASTVRLLERTQSDRDDMKRHRVADS